MSNYKIIKPSCIVTFFQYKKIKYLVRKLFLATESLLLGKYEKAILPTGIEVSIRRGSHSKIPINNIIQDEIYQYWIAHSPRKGEVHLDIGAQIGSYSLLAASSGALVNTLEPDPNNLRFLKRNIKDNNLNVTIVPLGVWNEKDTLNFRSHDALSSIEGVGMIPTTLPFLHHIKVDTIDNHVERLSIKKVHVIKMDIEGAEIEAIEGARRTIMKHRPVLLIESYHVRDGVPTLDRVLAYLRLFGIPDSAITVTDQVLIIVQNY